MLNTNYRLPKRKDGQKTFDNILETAKRLFSQRGYQATSINEIISESKIATGTFYLYFDDKLALYTYLLMRYRRNIGRAIASSIENTKTRYEKERLGLIAFLKFVSDDQLAYRIIWESMFVDAKLFREYYESFSNHYVKQLTISKNDGEVDPAVNLETISYVLMGISNFVGLQVLFKGNLELHEIEAIADQVMYVLENGMFLKK